MEKRTMEGFRLSPQQERVWSLTRGAHAAAPFRVEGSVTIEGGLDTRLLKSALGLVVGRHEILRTTFQRPEGMTLPLQFIEDEGFELRAYDLSGMEAAAREAESVKLAEESRLRVFDLERGPALRASLVTLTSDESVLHLSLPALCADAETLKSLVHELALAYDACARGEGLSGEPLQYADLAEWLNELLETEEAEAGREFWRRQQTKGDASTLSLVRAEEPAAQFAPESFELAFDHASSINILAACVRAGVEPRAFLLACWQSLLWRLSGEPAFAVGVAFDGRALEELKGALGPLTRYLPLACGFEEGTRFDELLDACAEGLREASKAQNFFSRGDADVLPFCFSFEEAVPPVEAVGVRFTLARLDARTEGFALKLEARAVGESFKLRLHFDPSRVERERAGRIGAQLVTLVGSTARDTRARVSELELLCEDERRLLVHELNETAREYERARLHELFERQAALTPDRVALVYEDSAVTYAELDRRADAIARRLRRLGVGPEVIVPVYLERSAEMVEALLAILKAGGAYLPLDRAYPRARLALMLEEVNAPVLITQTEIAEELPECGARVLCLDVDESPEVEMKTGRASSGEEYEDALAYVIYTSGSTGRPKGAMLTHAGVVNCVRWMQEVYKLEESDSFLFKTPLGFDPSVWELFWTLGAGARVVVARPGGQMDNGYLAEVVEREQVTSAYFVPGMLGAMLEEAGARAAFRTLRRVICGGEALPAETLERFFELSEEAQGRVELHHSYGPTEVSIAATEWTCERGESVRMGGPLGNTRVYVFDARGGVAPACVAGELYVGGRGVGRGYLARPETTAERFVPDPFSTEPGARLYKTGDVVRWVGLGEAKKAGLEFVGRVDHQVKLRGQRIELGEVEAALRSHAGVRDAVVEVREDARGERRLVGYVVWRGGEHRAADLRAHLRERLPDYLVPSAWVALDAWPLMANGKVDRRALPAPAAERSEFDEAFVAPRTPVEEVLAEVWSEVLGAERVGIDDNYFALGGDSIRAVRVVALARRSGFEISLQQLFQHQTIRELARELNVTEPGFAPHSKTEPFGLVSEADRARLPEDVEDAYPLAMLQSGMLFQIELMSDAPVYHGVNSWPLRGPMSPEVFQRAVDKVVARHPILRTSFDLTRYTEPLQLVHKTARLEVYFADLRGMTEAEQEARVLAHFESEKARAFDLSRPPLFRLHVHTLSDETFYFGLTECHPILDGWSLTSTLAEIFKHYFAILDGEELPAEPPPRSTYRDFVHLERLALDSEASRSYWEEKLGDCTVARVPRWPSSSSRADGKRVLQPSVEITPETNEGLKRLARLAGTPLKSVLLAAHLRVLSLVTGQTDVLTGVTSNGRLEELDGEQVRGLFLNSVPFRLKLGGGTWVELARETFKAELELLPHRRYPMAALKKSSSGPSLFETLFNFVHFHAIGDVFRSRRLERIPGRTFGSEENSFTVSAGFSMSPVTAHVTLLLDCDARELSEAQIRRLGEYYGRVLRAMAEEPEGLYESRALLDAGEYEQLLEVWNGARPVYETSRCLHQLFEEQAARTPDAVALTFGEEQLTYAELNRRANRLARRLRRLGVRADSLVGLCMERGLDVLVAILGTLKAGGAYVPLDPALPAERLSMLVKDAGVSVLLAQESAASSWVSKTKARVVYLDTETEDFANESDANLSCDVMPDNLAYVIYTSGSTGRPKGVLVSHANVTRLFDATREQFNFDEGDVWTLFHSYAFDFSVWEIWGPLLHGGRLVVLPHGLSRSPEAFRELASREQVTVLNQTPSAFKQFVSADAVTHGAQSLALRLVIFGGEALDLQSLRPWYERHGDAAPLLVNMYGITETTVHVTSRPLSSKDLEAAPGSRIGGAISDLRLYMLDRHFGLAPIGSPGEMHVGGAGLARGYLNAPELTAQRFVPDPFGAEPGARLYKSGDLGRYLPGGDVEYLGRLDHQVKVRGFRIELGEIESVLSEHPAVRENVALAVGGAGGEQRLVAYVVPREDSPGLTGRLRAYLKERLPGYMVPAAFVTLDALPLTPNGKLDRRALPAPPHARQQLDEAYVAPSTDAERIIANVWQEVLRVEQVGTHDNFFDLGGDSIMLVRAHSVLREALGRELSMIDLFRYPSIRALTDYLKGDANGAETAATTDARSARLSEGKGRLQRLRTLRRVGEEGEART